MVATLWRVALVAAAAASAATTKSGAAAAAGNAAGEPEDLLAPQVRVLFIGNSYTFFNDLPQLFASVAGALPTPRIVNVSMVAPGGSSLFQHANLSLPMGTATAAALADPAGWDYVVLQDQSEVPGGGQDTDDDLGPGAGRNLTLAALSEFFATRIRAAGAVPVLYSTWGRHDGDPPNADCCGYGDFRGMNALTTQGYEMYADKLRAALAASGAAGADAAATTAAPADGPVCIASAGRAFELVFNRSGSEPLDPSTMFSCLYNHKPGHARSTPVVVQAGGGGDPRGAGTHNHHHNHDDDDDNNNYNNNNNNNASCMLDSAGLGGHPSLEGSYTIALVLAATVFGESAATVSWAPSGVSAADAAVLRQVAQLAVAGGPGCTHARPNE